MALQAGHAECDMIYGGSKDDEVADDSTVRADDSSEATTSKGGENAGPSVAPDRCEFLGNAISAVLGGALKEYDERAAGAARSQDELAAAVDRLTGELDKLLEDAPLPLIVQQAAKISSIRRRVSALNFLLRSIQRRMDNIDRVLSTGMIRDNAPALQTDHPA